MSTPTVEAFVIDEVNQDKFWDHGLTDDQVNEVLDGVHLIKRNRKRRRASYLLVGRDYQGRCLAIPIERTHDPRVWRPVTA